MKRPRQGLVLSEHGCPPRTAGYMAYSEGRENVPPHWLPGHDEEYQAEWSKGWEAAQKRECEKREI